MELPICLKMAPKNDSLVIRSLGLHFALVTETWYWGGRALKNHLVHLEGATGLKVIHKSRDGRSSRQGCGIAVGFKTSTCNFKQKQLKPMSHEFVCAVGRVGKIARRVAVYVPPDIKARQLEHLMEAVAAELAALKSTYKNPLIIFAGDINHRDFGPSLSQVDVLKLVRTEPTRGKSTIDLVYMHEKDLVTDNIVLPSLQARNGTDSNHR